MKTSFLDLSTILFATSALCLVAAIIFYTLSRKNYYFYHLTCQVVPVLFVASAATFLINVLHQQKRDFAASYCRALPRSSAEFLLECGSTASLCQAYEDGRLTKTSRYCKRCVQKELRYPGYKGIDTVIPNPAYTVCLASYQPTTMKVA